MQSPACGLIQLGTWLYAAVTSCFPISAVVFFFFFQQLIGWLVQIIWRKQAEHNNSLVILKLLLVYASWLQYQFGCIHFNCSFSFLEINICSFFTRKVVFQLYKRLSDSYFLGALKFYLICYLHMQLCSVLSGEGEASSQVLRLRCSSLKSSWSWRS